MFLAPLFLLGLLGLAVPVIIHLMQSPRAQIVQFPTIRFLQLCSEKASRRARIKNVLLLLLRMLLILIIVLAMAKPWFEAGEGSVAPEAPVSMVIVLDHSYSMGFVDQGQTRFTRARAAAIELVDTLKPGDEVAVILMSDRAEPYVRDFTTDQARVRKALEDAELSYRPTVAEPSLSEAFRMVDARIESATDPADAAQRRFEIHLLSDMQAVGFTSIMQGDMLRTIDTRAHLYISDFGSDANANAYVEHVRVTGTSADQVTVTAQVRAWGAADPGNLATLSVDGRAAAAETFTVRAGRPELVPIAASFDGPGTYQCTVTLRQDALPIDDTYHFAVTVGEQSKVLVVDGDPSAIGPLSESYYLRAALSPGAVSAFDVTVITPAQLRDRSLDEYAVVILANVAELEGSSLARVEGFLKNGGGLLLFAGDRVKGDQWNRWPFMPITLTSQYGSTARRDDFNLSVTAPEHPVFDHDIDLRTARFFVALDSDLRSIKPRARILARFRDGQPALIEGDYEGGRVMLFTSSCDLAWNNLALRRVFVPWVHQLTAYLARTGAVVATAEIGDTVTFQAPATAARKTVTVTDPEGATASIVPRVEGDYAVASFGPVEVPGAYKVVADAAFSNSGGFGANLRQFESNVARVDRDEFLHAVNGDVVTFLDTADQAIAGRVRESREGTELWTVLFTIAVLVFLGESLFGNILSRVRRRVDEVSPDEELFRHRTRAAVE